MFFELLISALCPKKTVLENELSKTKDVLPFVLDIQDGTDTDTLFSINYILIMISKYLLNISKIMTFAWNTYYFDKLFLLLINILSLFNAYHWT